VPARSRRRPLKPQATSSGYSKRKRTGTDGAAGVATLPWAAAALVDPPAAPLEEGTLPAAAPSTPVPATMEVATCTVAGVCAFWPPGGVAGPPVAPPTCIATADSPACVAIVCLSHSAEASLSASRLQKKNSANPRYHKRPRAFAGGRLARWVREASGAPSVRGGVWEQIPWGARVLGRAPSPQALHIFSCSRPSIAIAWYSNSWNSNS
jgi:hypothetical protein